LFGILRNWRKIQKVFGANFGEFVAACRGYLVMKQHVFDTKKHSNIKRRAEYRRIGKYFKSLEKFKGEKKRLNQILALQDQRQTIKQIANQLNISQRTVKRDLAKIAPYIKKQQTHLLLEENQQTLMKFQSLSFKEQLAFIDELREQQKRIWRVRKCDSLWITVDVDSVLAGRDDGVRFKPNLPVDMQENGRITLELSACGRKQAVARIYLEKIVWRQANLQTNQSMNLTVKPTLKGLKIIEPETNA
jgi:hypothetical protein